MVWRANPRNGTPTKAEHDAIVAEKGRPFTDKCEGRKAGARSTLTQVEGRQLGEVDGE